MVPCPHSLYHSRCESWRYSHSGFGFTAAEDQTQLVKALFRRLAEGDTVGEALVAAHADVRATFNLLGDPAAR